MPALILPPDIERRLDAISVRTGRSRNEHVLEAILDYLEDFEDGELAEARLAAVARGGETIALADLLTRYGLDADGKAIG